MTQIWSEILAWLSGRGFRVGIIVVGTIIALITARLLASRLITVYKRHHEERELQKRADTLGSMFRHLLGISILFIAAMLLLDQFGIKLGPMLAAAGVIGIAVGFGAQHLVQDITNGIFIMLDDEIRVGDVVEVAGKSGLVEQVSLRQTVLRDLEGNVHFIPNSQIGVVTNMSKVFSYCMMNIGVAYREDVDEVIATIRLVDEELRADQTYAPDILEPVDVMGLDQFADSALIIKARIKVKPLKQWVIRREFNKRLKRAFDARNIEIPFPHVTLYMGEGKNGESPALNVALAGKEPQERKAV